MATADFTHTIVTCQAKNGHIAAARSPHLKCGNGSLGKAMEHGVTRVAMPGFTGEMSDMNVSRPNRTSAGQKTTNYEGRRVAEKAER